MLQGQIAFLPYHSEWVAWPQRLMLFIDVALTWYFWNRIRVDDDSVVACIASRTWRWVRAVGSVCVVIFSVFIATFSGELAHEYIPNVRFIPSSDPTGLGASTK